MESEQAMAVVLAAGKGTRMKSDLPKVLAPVLGKPMVEYVLSALRKAGVHRIVVVIGYRGDLIRESLAGWDGVEFVEQKEQLGTGHAVKMCRNEIQSHRGPVVVLAGDSPMTQAASLVKLLAEFRSRPTACLLGTLHKAQPAGLGRIVRSAEGEFEAIVEEKDATPSQRAITEVNMSTYVFQASDLAHALDRLEAKNAQKEYYLTDCPGILRREGKPVRALPVLQECEAFSVNTLEELAFVERALLEMQGSRPQ